VTTDDVGIWGIVLDSRRTRRYFC